MLPNSDTPTQELCIHELTHYRKAGRSNAITIPKALHAFLDWKEGELIVITAYQNSLVLRSIRPEMMENLRRHVQEIERASEPRSDAA